jgi:SAM-dependent methyltransferase
VGPSIWVERFAPLVPAGGPVLDVACGDGRHTRLFLARGHPVTAVDRDASGVAGLDAEVVEADLETGAPPPWRGRRFAGVVVTRYLHRPLMPALVAAVAPGGLLLYETFAVGPGIGGTPPGPPGREHGPSNPDYLLLPGELLRAVRGRLRVLAYEDLDGMQRLCALRQ